MRVNTGDHLRFYQKRRTHLIAQLRFWRLVAPRFEQYEPDTVRATIRSLQEAAAHVRRLRR